MIESKLAKKRIALYIGLFLILAGALFIYLNKVFSMGDDDSNRQIFKAFYAEKENTIDVIYYGTSAANRYYIGPLAYHEEGISAFSVATMGMPMFFTEDLNTEVNKTQNPKLVIIEMRWFLKEREEISDAHIRRVTDNLKLSGTKATAINRAFDYMEGSEGMSGDISEKKIDYYMPIMKYHSRFAQGEMKRGDWKLTSTKNETKGYVISSNTVKQVNQSEARLAEGRNDLSDISQRTLDELLDYCDSSDREYLFVLSPYSVRKSQMPVLNEAIAQVENRGYKVINFNTDEMYDELNIDWDRDFYNSRHVNYMGAEKYTRWLTDYIKDNYELDDHRGDSKYASWEKAYEKYRDFTDDGIRVKVER